MSLNEDKDRTQLIFDPGNFGGGETNWDKLDPEVQAILAKVATPGQIPGGRAGPFTGTDFTTGAQTVRSRHGMEDHGPGSTLTRTAGGRYVPGGPGSSVYDARNTNPYMSAHGSPDPGIALGKLTNAAIENQDFTNVFVALEGRMGFPKSKIDSMSDEQVGKLIVGLGVPVSSVYEFRQLYDQYDKYGEAKRTVTIGPADDVGKQPTRLQDNLPPSGQQDPSGQETDETKKGGIDKLPGSDAPPPKQDGSETDSVAIEENPQGEAGSQKETVTEDELIDAVKNDPDKTEEEKKTLLKRISDFFAGLNLPTGTGLLVGGLGALGLGNIFKKKRPSKKDVRTVEDIIKSDGTTTPGDGTTTPGENPHANLSKDATGKEVFDSTLENGTTDGLTEEQLGKLDEYIRNLPPGSVPAWLLAALGLAAATSGTDGPQPSSLQEAAALRSMEVYGNKDLFDPFGPSILQTIDPRLKNSRTFMPTGEVPNFNLGYRGVPGQMYANYQGSGFGGTAGPMGGIASMQPLVRDGAFPPVPAQPNYVPVGPPGGMPPGGMPPGAIPPGFMPFNQYNQIATVAGGGFPRKNGQIAGPGTETSDDIPAMLSDGEFVVNAKAVRGIGNLLGRKKPKSKREERMEGARMMYALQRAGEQAARMS